jgi:N-dimethylarginine dimethylaminohydrolase
MAHGFRTDPEAHTHVGEILQKEVISLELTDPRFYHLDTCFAYLPGPDVLFYYPGAFSKDSIRKIRQLPSRRIEITEEEACHFACNSVLAENTLLLHHSTDRLRKLLEELKIQPVTAGTSEFLKAGGSVRCMVLQLH